jgi:hypothetical protein
VGVRVHDLPGSRFLDHAPVAFVKEESETRTGDGALTLPTPRVAKSLKIFGHCVFDPQSIEITWLTSKALNTNEIGGCESPKITLTDERIRSCFYFTGLSRNTLPTYRNSFLFGMSRLGGIRKKKGLTAFHGAGCDRQTDVDGRM